MHEAPSRRLASGDQIKALPANLEKTRDDPSNWQVYYQDPITGDEWYSGVYEEGWASTHYLVKLPGPSPEELVQTAVHTPHRDEALVASLPVKRYPEPLGALMDELERLSEGASPEGWERTEDVIKWASLVSEVNRREILGESADLVESDYQHFLDIAQRARRLQETAERRKRGVEG